MHARSRCNIKRVRVIACKRDIIFLSLLLYEYAYTCVHTYTHINGNIVNIWLLTGLSIVSRSIDEFRHRIAFLPNGVQKESYIHIYKYIYSRIYIYLYPSGVCTLGIRLLRRARKYKFIKNVAQSEESCNTGAQGENSGEYCSNNCYRSISCPQIYNFLRIYNLSSFNLLVFYFSSNERRENSRCM